MTSPRFILNGQFKAEKSISPWNKKNAEKQFGGIKQWPAAAWGWACRCRRSPSRSRTAPLESGWRKWRVPRCAGAPPGKEVSGKKRLTQLKVQTKLNFVPFRKLQWLSWHRDACLISRVELAWAPARRSLAFAHWGELLIRTKLVRIFLAGP